MSVWARGWSYSHVRRAFLATCLVTVLVHAVVLVNRRSEQPGDFDVSREFGKRFVERTYLYEGGVHYPYMPTAAMAFAPLALVTPTVGFVVRYLASLASLWVTLYLVGLMVGGTPRPMASRRFAVGALALVLGSQYVIRDLDDAGPHLILLAITTAGIYFAWAGRAVGAGVWFGLAAAIKAPLGIFIPFLWWKRQWRLAALATASTAAWICVPMVWMGPESWWAHQREWTAAVIDGPREPERRLQNQSLDGALMHYLAAYPSGHPNRAAEPAHGSVGFLPPDTAVTVAGGVIIGLLALFAWHTRRPYRTPRDDLWGREGFSLLVLSVLLSPIVWVQHMVLVLPALGLIAARHLGTHPLRGGPAVAMGVFVLLALVLNRELVGREASLVLLAFHHHTVALLLVLAIVLRRPSGAIALDT